MADEIESYHLAHFNYFYTREEKKIPVLWTALTGSDATTQITNRLAELREQAFISYAPLRIIEHRTPSLELTLLLLRDALLLNAFFCSKPPISDEAGWKDCSSKLTALKSALSKSESAMLGQTTVLIAEETEAFEYVVSAQKLFGKNSYSETKICCGKLYQFSDTEQLGLPHEFLLLYEGEKQELANQLLVSHLPSLDISITKLEKLILNFQQQRLEMLEKKREIETFLTESLESPTMKSKKPAERSELLETAIHFLSDSYAWLNRASSLVKNSQTVIHAGIDNLNKFRQHIYSPEQLAQSDFISQRYLATFAEYEKQLAIDYAYLEKTLKSVQDALRNFNTHLDIDRGRIQEIFYRRVIILFLLVVSFLVGSSLFYLFYIKLWR